MATTPGLERIVPGSFYIEVTQTEVHVWQCMQVTDAGADLKHVCLQARYNDHVTRDVRVENVRRVPGTRGPTVTVSAYYDPSNLRFDLITSPRDIDLVATRTNVVLQGSGGETWVYAGVYADRLVTFSPAHFEP